MGRLPASQKNCELLLEIFEDRQTLENEENFDQIISYLHLHISSASLIFSFCHSKCSIYYTVCCRESDFWRHESVVGITEVTTLEIGEKYHLQTSFEN